MKLNIKVSILFSLAYIIFFIGFISLWNNQKDKIEIAQKNRIEEFRKTFNEILTLKSSSLTSYLYDNTYWDDMVSFVSTKDTLWAQNNLIEPSNIQDYDYTVVYDTQKKIVFYHQRTSSIPSITTDLSLESINVKKPEFSHYYLSKNGIIIEIFSAPIQPTRDIKRISVPKGYRIIGKIWTSDYTKNYSKITKQKVDLLHHANTSLYDFNYPLTNYKGEPVAYLGVKLSSITMDTLNKVLRLQLYMIIIIGSLALLMVAIVMYYIIGKPLTNIAHAITTHDVTQLSSLLNKSDELGDIAKAIKQLFTQGIDSLTQLSNKEQLTKDLELRHNPTLALINISNFRRINESFGHETGDLLLTHFAQRLKKTVHGYAKVYRLSGDEFAILFNHDEIEKIEQIVHEIIEVLEKDLYTISQTSLTLRVMIAIASGDENIRQKCDMAMHFAKTHNLTYVNFNHNLQIMQEIEQAQRVTAMIQHALKHDLVQPYGQKVVNSNNLNEYKIETLMRIVDEQGKVTSPIFFLEQAKKARLYTKLTREMLKKSFDHFKNNSLVFSINLTFEDIIDEETITLFYNLIEQHNIGDRLIVEIVESEQLMLDNEVMEFIKKIKSYGCKISIDDFGSGYSNFEYLITMQADYLKIDGSLIKNIDTDPNALLTVKTIIALAKELGLAIVAEFVHSQSVLECVQSLGVDYLQGYHLHEPQPLEIIR